MLVKQKSPAGNLSLPKCIWEWEWEFLNDDVRRMSKNSHSSGSFWAWYLDALWMVAGGAQPIRVTTNNTYRSKIPKTKVLN